MSLVDSGRTLLLRVVSLSTTACATRLSVPAVGSTDAARRAGGAKPDPPQRSGLTSASGNQTPWRLHLSRAKISFRIQSLSDPQRRGFVHDRTELFNRGMNLVFRCASIS